MKPTDLLCDPMCGVGSLPAEALSTRFKCAYALRRDSSKSAIRDAGSCAGMVAYKKAKRSMLRGGMCAAYRCDLRVLMHLW